MFSKGHTLQLRSASPRDDHLLFRWRNDPSTRPQFFSSDPVSWEEHEEWLGRVLSDPSELLIIGEQAGRSVGVVRLTETTEGVAVSITVDPQNRGRGIGGQLLKECLVEFQNEWPSGLPFVARIKVGNTASLKIFRSCGFAVAAAQNDAVLMHKMR